MVSSRRGNVRGIVGAVASGRVKKRVREKGPKGVNFLSVKTPLERSVGVCYWSSLRRRRAKRKNERRRRRGGGRVVRGTGIPIDPKDSRSLFTPRTTSTLFSSSRRAFSPLSLLFFITSLFIYIYIYMYYISVSIYTFFSTRSLPSLFFFDASLSSPELCTGPRFHLRVYTRASTIFLLSLHLGVDVESVKKNQLPTGNVQARTWRLFQPSNVLQNLYMTKKFTVS